jgi:hypothetical protein
VFRCAGKPKVVKHASKKFLGVKKLSNGTNSEKVTVTLIQQNNFKIDF